MSIKLRGAAVAWAACLLVNAAALALGDDDARQALRFDGSSDVVYVDHLSQFVVRIDVDVVIDVDIDLLRRMLET